MKNLRLLLIVYSALSLCSCTRVGNLYPLSENDRDFVSRTELIGKWGDLRDSLTFFMIDTAMDSGGKLYQIKMVSYDEEKKTTDSIRVAASLLRISGSYFFDCRPEMEQEFGSLVKKYEDWLISWHFIFRLAFPGKDKIEMFVPKPEEWIRLIRQKKILLHYATLQKDDYLILDKPELLRNALKASLNYGSLYHDTTFLRRLQ